MSGSKRNRGLIEENGSGPLAGKVHEMQSSNKLSGKY